VETEVIKPILAVIFLIVVLAVVVFYVMLRYSEVGGQITREGFKIIVSSKDSSQINEQCREFYGAYFSPDFGYEKKFGGLFPESSGDELYRELKLFCGAMIEIEDAVDSGGDLEGVVGEINDAYSYVYGGLEFDLEEIHGAIDDNPKTVWLGEVQNI
jgi:hypothetical protein